MKKLLTALLMLLCLGSYVLIPAEARRYPYDGYYGGYGYHPYIQKALIGGGIGAAAGSLLGRRDPVGAGIKSALLGSAIGVGYQYWQQNSYGGYGRGYGYGRRGYGCGHYRHSHHHRDWDDD